MLHKENFKRHWRVWSGAAKNETGLVTREANVVVSQNKRAPIYTQKSTPNFGKPCPPNLSPFSSKNSRLRWILMFTRLPAPVALTAVVVGS